MKGFLLGVLPLAVGAALLVGSGCDPRRLVLETELAPGLRDDLVRGCCECLVTHAPPSGGEVCGDTGAPPVDDAGTTPDGRCLCGGLETAACADHLIGGGSVEVVGACTAEDGACHDACDGVLAYPP